MARWRLIAGGGLLFAALVVGACRETGADRSDGPGSQRDASGGEVGGLCHGGGPCGGSEACCLSGCADLATDSQNCGVCSRACAAPASCVLGECRQPLPPPPSCPAVGAAEICVNGWVRDFDDKGSNPYGRDTLITDDSVEIWVFDPFMVLLCSTPPCFDTNQAIAGPFYANSDGTYLLFEDRASPPRRINATGSYIAIGTMNKGGTPVGGRNWVGCGITADGKPGTVADLDIYAVGQAQIDAWEASYAGLLSKGILVLMWQYLDVGEPDPTKNRTFIAGVTPNRSPSPIDVSSFYFMTTDRNTVVQGSAGGVNRTSEVGGALFVRETLGPHSATGGVVPGSSTPVDWESRLGASVPSLVFVQFFNQKLQ
ncbi:MAG: hypothetical protein HY906_16840 [Deltaproteobacteria bacterium]|nr:hypothetical protein [Deltaproteobacteria bacterium]